MACCTEDIQLLQTPVSPIEGIYKGSEGIERYFADLGDAGPDFRVTIDRLETVGADRVVGFVRLNMSGRAKPHKPRW